MLDDEALYFIGLDGEQRGSNKLKLAPLHHKLREEVEGTAFIKIMRFYIANL
jgi:hypothetical protein